MALSGNDLIIKPFGLKIESYDEFIGLSMEITDDKFVAKQRVVTKPRFQHVCANKPLKAQTRNVISQIYSALDRVIGVCPSESISDVISSFLMVGFKAPLLQDACTIICLKHPYLKVILHDGLTTALLRHAAGSNLF